MFAMNILIFTFVVGFGVGHPWGRWGASIDCSAVTVSFSTGFSGNWIMPRLIVCPGFTRMSLNVCVGLPGFSHVTSNVPVPLVFTVAFPSCPEYAGS